jgi:hypothetical protein
LHNRVLENKSANLLGFAPQLLLTATQSYCSGLLAEVAVVVASARITPD